MYTGEDEALRAVQMQVRTKFMFQPIQVQYPLELHCDVPAKEVKVQEETNLNAGVREYRPRPNAAATADARIQDINATNDNESESKWHLIIILSNGGSMSQTMGWPCRKSDLVETLNLCATDVIVVN